MVVELRDTVANTIQVFDDGTTLAEILSDLGWASSERERHRVKSKKTYVPTGKPIGRPRKIRTDIILKDKSTPVENTPAEA